MRTYRGLAVSAILAAAVAATARPALGQADAAEAYQQGKTAFAAGQFDKARDLFAAAAKTDTKNPEVFLMLGKADYELGKVDEAMAAWSATVQLAPNEPYAGHMLQALRGDAADAGNMLHLADILSASEQYDASIATLDRLLSRSALSDEDRAKAMMQKAGAMLDAGRAKDVEPIVQEARIKFPKTVNADEADLLLARGWIALGGDKTADGVTALRAIAAKPNAAAADAAQGELLIFLIAQNPTSANADALKKWIVPHGADRSGDRARRALVEGLFAISAVAGKPAPDAALTDADRSAIDIALEVYRPMVNVAQAEKWTQHVLGYLVNLYACNQSYQAVVEGTTRMMKVKLPPSSMTLALQTQAKYQVEIALNDAKRLIDSGRPPAAMPQTLIDAIATLNTLNQSYPAESAWEEQAELAARLSAMTESMAWPPTVTALKPPDDWAVQIALPILKSNDQPASEHASKILMGIAMAYAHQGHPATTALALDVNVRLLAQLTADSPAWPQGQWQRVGLLDQQAAAQFAENIKTGNADQNAILSPTQNELIATLGKIVAVDAKQAKPAVDHFGAHLKPWLNQSYFSLARDAYAKFAVVLPASEQKVAQLMGVELSIQGVLREQGRQTSTGLSVPRKLDPEFEAALKQLYTMQADLPSDHWIVGRARQAAQAIVAHYMKLEYFDTAETAIGVKGDKPVVAADIFVEFELANLRNALARRDLEQRLKHFDATEKLTITPAAKTAIDAYENFILAHPADPLARSAAEQVFEIARLFEGQGVYDVAAEVYQSFAAFSEKNKVLLKTEPGAASPAEQAAFAGAAALDAKARVALARLVAARKSDGPPPAKLSDESRAAITAYRDFIKAHPQSPLIGSSLQRILAIALEYARADAWDPASGVYASLLDPAGPAIADPERIDLFRGLCEVGKVMPDHAKEVLAALTSGRFASPGAHDAKEALATAEDFKKSLDSADSHLLPTDDASGFFIGGSGGTGELTERGADAAAAKPAAAAPPALTRTGAGSLTLSGANTYNGGTTITSGTIQSGGVLAPPGEHSRADQDALAAISQQESHRAQMVAQLRDREITLSGGNNYSGNMPQQQGQSIQNPSTQPAALLVIPPEELARQQAALDAAYAIFQAIITKTPNSVTAVQARGEILVALGWWRGEGQWQRSADLARKFLAANPADPELPRLRIEIAQDALAFAATPAVNKPSKAQMLDEVSQRFTAARDELTKILADFPKQDDLRQQAQWLIATSFLTQARVVDGFSPTLARGQYARAARELQRVAEQYADNPQIANVPQMLWSVAQELAARQYFEEAISVSNDLAVNYPTDPVAQQATVFVANTYQSNLGRPLRAAELFLEINFSRGGADIDSQNRVFAIGSALKDQKRWVEALHVLQTFVDSFPQHPNAGQALTMIGQIHQANEAWDDAIAAYRRVIDEYPAGGDWAQAAKWSIAECIINLSHWKEAIDAYQTYVNAYPQDAKVPEGNRRIGILKDLANYQKLVDENGPKAFDAEFQMASIIQKDLGNPYKAIIEYRKVSTNWPKSHLADHALYAVGLIYLDIGELELARANLQQVATLYPDSPMADSALFTIGKSYEDEAAKLATLNRDTQMIFNGEAAQKDAYRWANDNKSIQRAGNYEKLQALRQSGKKAEAERLEGTNAANNLAFDTANTYLAAQKAEQMVEDVTAAQLADRQDKINAALRKAVGAYSEAATIPGGDKAGEALLRVAVLQGDRLNEPSAAMATWLEIVRQFSGTAVAEEASWRIAQTYEKQGKFAESVEAYKAFLRNYRRSPRAQEAQFAIAENYEHLGQWVPAMDQYTNYLTNFPEGPLANKAREQISFIKTYRL